MTTTSIPNSTFLDAFGAGTSGHQLIA